MYFLFLHANKSFKCYPLGPLNLTVLMFSSHLKAFRSLILLIHTRLLLMKLLFNKPICQFSLILNELKSAAGVWHFHFQFEETTVIFAWLHLLWLLSCFIM